MQQESNSGSRAIRVDAALANKLFKSHNGDTMKFCYQCGVCSSVCPISRYIGTYRPNRIIELAKLGIRNRPQSNAFLFCSACTLCTKGCPQNVRVHEIMQALKDQAIDDADVKAFLERGFSDVVEALGSEIPFPITYSWICLRPPSGHAPGSGDTASGDPDNSPDSAYMEIIKKALEKALKAPAAQNSVQDDVAVPQPPARPAAPGSGAKRVAIIGSGPAGLTAAWELARAGFAVTVYENQPVAGGMLRVGIPGYRLPKDIVETEIEWIRSAGVEILTNVTVNRDMFDYLTGMGEHTGNSEHTGNGFDAVFIATGMRVSRKLNVTGEDLKGVRPALEFLSEYNTTGKADIGKNVVVIGGGNVATDSAGAALRCGAESVKLFYRRDRKKMPAHEWEIEEVLAEGVELNTSWWPKAFHGDGEKVTSAEFIFCKSVTDKDGKFNPVFDEKKTVSVDADTVIVAVGQSTDLSFLNDGVDVSRGYIQADPYTLETSLPNVFAGGDAVSGALGGAASLVEAIACGKTAAASIIKCIMHNA